MDNDERGGGGGRRSGDDNGAFDDFLSYLSSPLFSPPNAAAAAAASGGSSSAPPVFLRADVAAARACLAESDGGSSIRVIAKIEWHPGELFPKVGFIVTNLPMEPDWVVRFYNQRGTAEQHIKEGKYAFRWTRLSCRKFRHNEVRLQLHALAYNLATFLRCIELPEAMADWSLTSLQLKLIKIGARVVRHARAITFQLAEVAVTGPMVRAILAAIHRLRAPPICA